MKKQPQIVADEVENQLLPFVRRPGRYIGGEVNQIRKDLNECELTVALCFPDVYEVGMSHTGLAILYEVLNRMDKVAAERVFAPWTDAEKILRQENIPLFSLESKAAVGTFDIIGFSLTTELCYTNVLNMLELAGLEVRGSNRGKNSPLIIAGGAMSNCCEPMAEFIDLFVLGEAEEAIVELAELVIKAKRAKLNKQDILKQAGEKFDWAYVPSLYEFDYSEANTGGIKSHNDKLKPRCENAAVSDFENAVIPEAPIVPFTQAVHERVNIEIMRGCPGRCRFCQASFCRRPVRFRSVDKIFDTAVKAYGATGFETVSLLSLSTADYPQLEELVTKLNDYFKDRYVGISVPSLRVDKQLKILPQLVRPVRKGGLTIAVEAASENVRRIINKPIKDSDLFAAVEAAYKAGWQKLKLYFMVGLPGETQDDIVRLVELCNELALLRKKITRRPADISVAISWFVPKPHTPFQWVGQKPKAYFDTARQIILDKKRELKAKYLHFKFHNIQRSILESSVGRGDRRMCEVIETARRNGAKFDLWDECFDFNIWKSAFEAHGLDVFQLAGRKFAPEQSLPWEHLGGPDKDYLLRHYNQAMQTT